MTGPEESPKPTQSPRRTPAFVWIAVGMLATLLLCGAAAAALLASRYEQIERDGGLAWLLAGGVFIAVATLVFSACAVCAAVSLLRRETHRALAIALLVGSCLFLWAFGAPTVRVAQRFLAQDDEAFDTLVQPRRPASRVVSRATIPDSLLRHFREQGIVLRAVRGDDRGTEFVFENADVGARCDVVTSFVRFPRGTTADDKRAYLQAISTPSVINENMDLAMFHPHARSTTSETGDCDNWLGKFPEINEKLLAAFKSYPPARIPVRAKPVG